LAELIRVLAYSSDDRYLASVSMDPALRLWDSSSGRQVGPPVRVSKMGFLHDVQFSSDDRRILYTATGGIWESPAPVAWGDALCDKLTANPSKKQWDEWVSPDIGYIEACPGLPDPPD
jgi:hypothetical protein